MIKIRCIAVDDEPPALRQMKEYITKVPYLELVDTFSNAIDTMHFLKDISVDLIFLDIHMEQLSGLALINLMKARPKIILTTAYDSYALEAFDLEVDDYLLKPISFDRFFKATEKIYSELAQQSEKIGSETARKTKDISYLFVKTKSRIQRIDLEQILYVEGLKEYLIIKTQNNRIITLMSFNQLLEKLPPDSFCRVHKSYVVAIGKIHCIRKNTIEIGDKIIPIGASFKEEFYKKTGY